MSRNILAKVILAVVLLAAPLFAGTTGLSTQQARTAVPSSLPLGNATSSEGTSAAFARADHVHAFGAGPVVGTGTTSIAPLGLVPQTPAPTTNTQGALYFNSVTNELLINNGTSWSPLPRTSQVSVNGTVNNTITVPTGTVGCIAQSTSGTVLVQSCSISGTTMTITMVSSVSGLLVSLVYW